MLDGGPAPTICRRGAIRIGKVNAPEIVGMFVGVVLGARLRIVSHWRDIEAHLGARP